MDHILVSLTLVDYCLSPPPPTPLTSPPLLPGLPSPQLLTTTHKLLRDKKVVVAGHCNYIFTLYDSILIRQGAEANI